MEATQANGNDAIADAKAAGGKVRERLMDDMQQVIDEAEQWLADSARDEPSISSEARARFDDSLRTARSDLHKLEDSFLAYSRDTAASVDVYVRDNPWRAASIGAAVGVLLGVLIARK
ncbi:YqjD family protein [Duganella sp. BuS-21]|uniref:DUF883 family protein n=1 Tax=Duganella sp. BuS-21 TaxID=2943848 RepID=UPI0035A6DA12